MSRMLRLFVPLGAAVLSILAGAAPAAAGTIEPLGPNQYYVGQVNGYFGHSFIAVNCVGQTGHPLAGQTITAQQISAPDRPIPNMVVGFTGSAVRTIAISVGQAGSTTSLVEMDAYGQRIEIPTTLVVPCGGSGAVAFVTRPTAADGIPATVPVNFMTVGHSG